ncbi:MAG: MerR family transcriptional regulator [Verrucomicrobiota bacterium]
MLFTIGEFSRITRLSVKALRFYHEKGLLKPRQIDSESGYRYYSSEQLQDARRISALKELDFSLSEIAEILKSCSDDRDLLDTLEAQRRKLKAKVSEYRKAIASMEQLIQREELAMKKDTNQTTIEEKQLDEMLIAGRRMQGRYDEIGKGFKLLGRHAGRFAAGKPFALHYCDEYRENDADYEACFPVRKVIAAEGIDCRQLPGGKALTLVHRGSYETIGAAYERLIAEIKERGLNQQLPSREIYIKGPGMIFKGKPENYLTEIQILVE